MINSMSAEKWTDNEAKKKTPLWARVKRVPMPGVDTAGSFIAKVVKECRPELDLDRHPINLSAVEVMPVKMDTRTQQIAYTRSPYFWTDAQVKSLLEMRKQGMTGAEIGKELGKSKEAVLKKLKHLGYNNNTRRVKGES